MLADDDTSSYTLPAWINHHRLKATEKTYIFTSKHKTSHWSLISFHYFLPPGFLCSFSLLSNNGVHSCTQPQMLSNLCWVMKWWNPWCTCPCVPALGHHHSQYQWVTEFAFCSTHLYAKAIHAQSRLRRRTATQRSPGSSHSGHWGSAAWQYAHLASGSGSRGDIQDTVTALHALKVLPTYWVLIHPSIVQNGDTK